MSSMEININCDLGEKSKLHSNKSDPDLLEIVNSANIACGYHAGDEQTMNDTIKISKKKLVNRSVLIDKNGRIKTYYDKIHMYDVKLSKKEKYFESKIFEAGNKKKLFKLPWGKLGLTICYDLRFPNLYRKLSKAGSLFISVPLAFTETTGKRHWHSLLKARAIENFCYIFAPAQGGTHYNGRKTFGHSMIVSPDGKILKELKKSEGVTTVTVDEKLPTKLRAIIPSLKSD